MLVILLIAINVVVFVIPYVINFGGRYGNSFLNFVSLGWKSNPQIADGELYRLLTSNFLHGSVTHLVLNMLALYNLGFSVLRVYGGNNLLFILTYIFSSICGSIFSFIFNPQNPSLGASGAIMGLIGSLMSYAIIYRNGALFQDIVINLVIIGVIGVTVSRIDNFGHIGGFLCGFVMYFVLHYLNFIS
ncbi:MAG: rhomboid family intramembrane serine protease [Patescibacteria group bacterium]